MKFKKMLLIGIKETSLDEEYWKRIDRLTEEKVFLPKEDPKIKEELGDSDCLLTGFRVNIGQEELDKAPLLKYIGVLATDFSKVDLRLTKSRGIVVTNVPGYSTESVAEFTFAAILEHLRDLETGKIRGREGTYSEADLKATEIKDKTFGVLGLGNIGRRVAEIAQGFGARVVYWSRNRKPELEAKGIEYMDADQLIGEADMISLNLAQTNDTNRFLNAKRLKNLKSGAIVINTAPMDLVDIDALEARLKKGDISFLYDHSDETSDEDNKRLSACKNCVVYPPMAYITDEARKAKQEIFVSNIENFMDGTPINSVN